VINCYLFIVDGDEDDDDGESAILGKPRGVVVAVMMPLLGDPNQAITTYADGRVERHRFKAPRPGSAVGPAPEGA
jgi:hypothetical protein